MSANDDFEQVVVIGASGFVGRRIVQCLSATQELRPIAAARRAPAGAGEIAWRACDATQPDSMAAALAGATCAVNSVAGDAATMVATTRNLCAAARAVGLRRIVHLSSMAVYGDATGLVDETRPLDPAIGWYADAKVTCESIVNEFVQSGGDAVVLRPGCIHGPRSEQWTGRIGRLLQRHRIGDLGAAGDGICNLVPVDDVAAAVVAALRVEGVAGEAFNLGDPDPGTWNDYFMRYARAIGATPVRRVTGRWLKLETKALAPMLKVGQIAAGRVGLQRWVADPLPGSLLSLWRQDIQLDHRKADAYLRFARTPPEAALAGAAAWFKTQT